MKHRTRWLLGGLAIGAGAVGAAGALLKRKKVEPKRVDVWARPGMLVTFRAELMPGRDGHGRTFRVKELLSSGRVSLHGVDGEHAEKEFERIHVDRPLEKTGEFPPRTT
jgi:hypothetical protein